MSKVSKKKKGIFAKVFEYENGPKKEVSTIEIDAEDAFFQISLTCQLLMNQLNTFHYLLEESHHFSLMEILDNLSDSCEEESKRSGWYYGSTKEEFDKNSKK